MSRLVAITMFLLTSAVLLVGNLPAQAAPAELVIVSAEQSLPPQAAKSAQSEQDTADEKAAAKSDAESGEKDSATKAKPDEATDKQTSADDAGDKKAAEKSDKKDKKSDDKANAKKKKEEKKPKPHKVKQEKLQIEVKVSGAFVANEMEEVELRPEVWTRFKVVEAVEHGATVKKGDVLVRFDDEKLEKDLAKEALDQNIGQLSMLQDEEEFPRVKRLLELSFENAERRHNQAKEDYDYYHSTDRPITVRIAHFRYKSSLEQLASAEEELKQLEQMYEADELTEETEEIVLRRQRFAVETAKLILELNKESRDYTLNVSLPRNDQYYETSLEEAELAYKQAKTALEMGGTRRNYDMEKKRNARAESIERHGKLLSDKALMVLRAPCDGVVYYGKCVNGKWSQISSMKAKLKPNGTASPKSVLMTIVKPGALHIESTLGEKDIPDMKAGLKATIVPTADKETELPGKVASVTAIPGASNKFPITLEFDNAESPVWLVAGMTCDAKVITYENDEAIVIPQDMVQTDEDNEKVKYVMLVDPEDDEPVRRKVKLGRKKDKIVEVLKGLKAGDEIVKEEKKDDK